MTVRDLLKPSNVSGYAHVGLVAGPSRGDSRPYYQAYANGGRRGDWKGPARATAVEAANDYVDHHYGFTVRPPSLPTGLRSAEHKVPRPRPSLNDIDDHEVARARGVLRDARAQRQGRKGYVYCIGESGHRLGVKVGYSTNPAARVVELQTGNCRPLVLLGQFEGTEDDEKELHAEYIADNLIGEWFSVSPGLLAEFDLSPEEIA